MKPRTILAIGIILFCFCPLIAAAETWSAPVFRSELNTPYRDISAFITADGKTLYMSSDRAAGAVNLLRMDLYVSHLIGDVWSPPEILPYPPNAPDLWDDKPSITLDGHYMYFYRSPSNKAWKLPGDIYMSENIDGVWQAAINLGPNVNTVEYDEVYPSVSPDGQALYFGSNRPGGYGDWDVWVANKVNGEWQPAVNLGSTINTAGREVSPTVSYSGRWLFFAYTPSLSAGDIARAEFIDGEWKTPVLLPTPVNTGKDETLSFFLDCTNTIYFARSKNNWDLATSTWLDAPGPNVCSSLVIPKGQWRVRVTLLEASASLRSDIYLDQPISQLLIRNNLKNIGTMVTTPFLSADELVFHIHVRSGSAGTPDYDHFSNGEFARVERTDPLRYIVGFEDLPADQADWDFDDVKLLIELVGVEVNLWEDQNYLGESQAVETTATSDDTVVGLPMTMGAALDAVATIPAAGLTEPTHTIITEGNPDLYAELMADAPFESSGDFIKLELLNGQNALANGEQAEISFFYLDADDDGELDGTSLRENNLRVFAFDQDLGRWEKLPGKVDRNNNVVSASASNFTLFALGRPRHPQGGASTSIWKSPASNKGNGSDSENEGYPGCSVGTAGTGSARTGNLLGVALLVFGPALFFRRTVKPN